MINPLPRLNWKQRLMLGTLVLGLIAVLIGNPGAGARVTIDTQELAWIISQEADHVTAAELADWLIAGREDYRLLDLRGEKDYAEYNIPSSENVPLATLIDTPLLRNEKLVLYGEGGVHAAQAWMLLAARGYKHVYMLKGGLDEWQDQILFPRLADSASAVQKAAFEKVKQISLHFGGTPQVGGAAESVAAPKALPKLSAPGGASVAKPGGGKKKKEGC